MSIVKLKNPKTKLYTEIKNHILGDSFDWYYIDETTPEFDKSTRESYDPILKRYNQEGKILFNPSMYCHGILKRSNNNELYPRTMSSDIDKFNRMYCEIFNSNKESMESFQMMCRCSANFVEPSQEEDIITVPHTDHNFPHKNMLVYLTDAGGSTFVEGEEFAPEEDDVIIFQGTHWHKLPRQKRRVVLVMTYI